MFLLAPVPASLRGLVHRVVAYDERAGAPVRRRQAPTPSATLVFGLGDPLRVDTTPVRSFVAGLADTAAITEFSGHQAGVQVDLDPLAVSALLGVPARVLGPVRPLDDLRGASAPGTQLARLSERLTGPAAWTDRLDLVVTCLTELAATRTAPAPEVTHAWRRLTAPGGRVPLTTLADEVGWSRRHLTRRVTDGVGLPPTTVARVVRFRRAADLLVPPAGTATPGRPVPRIADVAATCGFADHAHLDREFRALAGCTPRRYVAEWQQVGVDPADVTTLPG